MDLRALMDAHRIQQKHLLQFCEASNFKAHQSEFSKIINRRISTPKKYCAILRVALLSFGVSQAEIDAVPELRR